MSRELEFEGGSGAGGGQGKERGPKKRGKIQGRERWSAGHRRNGNEGREWRCGLKKIKDYIRGGLEEQIEWKEK